MFDIHVILQNSPGTLSRLTGLLGQHGIGLEGGGLFPAGAQSHAHFLVAEGERARRATRIFWWRRASGRGRCWRRKGSRCRR